MNASEVFQLHLATHLSSFKGTVNSLITAWENGGIPAMEDPGIRDHVVALQEHLKSKGMDEQEELVLLHALTAPGRFRGIDPPIDVLSTNRGGFSKGRKDEAAGAVQSFHKLRAIARLVVVDFGKDLLADLRNLSRVLDSAPPSAAWIAIHRDLGDADASDLAKTALGLLDDGSEEVRDLATSILGCLASSRDAGLGELTEKLVKARVFLPSVLFRNSTEAAASSLVALINEPGDIRRNPLLLALAWSSTSTSIEAFRNWKSSPPSWASQLHVPVEDYLHDAGMALDAKGHLARLTSPICHRIAVEPEDRDSLALDCRTPAGKACPTCGGGLSWLFDFSSLPDDSFPSAFSEAPRRFLYCGLCSCYGPTFSRYGIGEDVEWHRATTCEPHAEPFDLEPVKRYLCASKQPPFFASIPYDTDDATCLGGAPSWLQDSDYPSCPDCRAPMRFLAQFDNGSIPYEEGIHYAFFCGCCQVAAVTYQQT